MPEELLIARHAKSSWADEGISDHERPLNQRGLKDAPAMAAWLASKDLIPDIVLASKALRATTTAKLFCEQWLSDVTLTVLPNLYLAAADTYIEAINTYGNECRRVMVVGHNPGLEHLVAALTGVDEIMPTAAVAQVQLDSDTLLDLHKSGAKQTLARLIAVHRPKEVLG